MLWENCIPVQFCKFVYLKDSFTQLSQPQITFQKANDIVKNFVEQDEANIESLRQHLKDHAVTYQFLYVNLDPKIYSCNNHFGIHNKSIFEYTYRDWQQNIDNHLEKIRLMEVTTTATATKMLKQQRDKTQTFMSKDNDLLKN